MSYNIYGYMRVSTKDQNEDRQIIALRDVDIPAGNLYMDKQSGKDFQRPQYQRMVRRLGRDGEIIYLTSSPDYAVDSYLTQAFFYLLKPVREEQLFPVLERAVKVLQKRRSQATIVNTPAGLRSVPLSDILYVERVDRSMRYYLTGGEAVDSRTIRGSFREELAGLLADGRFAPCGASFVLGLHHVRSVEKGGVLLDSGTWVPVSRSAFVELKRAWMDYWLGGGEL